MRKGRRTLVRLGILVLAVVIACLVTQLMPKSTRNIVDIHNIESFEASDLAGYMRRQLIEVWGEPDDVISSTQDVWDISDTYPDGNRYLIVTYKPSGKVLSVNIVSNSIK